MAVLDDLPPEIILQLFPAHSLLEEFTRTESDTELAELLQPGWRSAFNLSRTCKKYRRMLVRDLYRNVSIHGSNSTHKLTSFIEFIMKHEDIAMGVRQLYLHLDASNTGIKDLTEADLGWSHWAAEQSGAPSPYYLWRSAEGKPLQMSESRRFRTGILHLGILLEIVLSRVQGLRELGLAVPGGLFCDQYGPRSRTEIDGLLWTGELGPSDLAKFRIFRGVPWPVPTLEMVAIRPSGLSKTHRDTNLSPTDLDHLLHFSPNARSIFIANRDEEPSCPLDTYSQWANITCLTITETFLVQEKIRSMVEGCASLVSFKYLNSRADTFVPHWPVSPREIVTILRAHKNTLNTLRSLSLDLNDWYRGEYRAIRSLSDFKHLENLWVDVSSVLKRIKYGSSSRSDKNKRLTHKLFTSFPRSIKRLHLAGNGLGVRHNICEVLTNREEYPELREVEMEELVQRLPELWDPDLANEEDDTDQSDVDDSDNDGDEDLINGDGTDDNSASWTLNNDGIEGGHSNGYSSQTEEEHISETIQETSPSYRERFIRAGIESPSTMCILGELW
ncbi:hypothetical protein BDP81DRAFT_511702 [Colletotrichum phormii]|uniref:Leucine-rich repeat domain-containing protein n=1 Tax=Colletotrichum phormii TaxID=359342 RepID=A0AAI9ZBV1_9PEZI|nr:uncharacterized protein BDP81DRAFT_511702 [Colletotrichum phormii]KAK1621650.1 hypothetical protein BDP81DRAFT_511702 [Colletotrichum phormii]